MECRECGVELVGRSMSQRYCNGTCKRRWWTKHGGRAADGGSCRQCGAWFPKGKGQNAKAVCSPECRKARLAQSVREFHQRRPYAEAVYRRRSREKRLPDSNLRRFYLWNPEAPRTCEACGEGRVVEVAHKPAHPRHGEHRSKTNYRWPELVWVLCPTCHRLIDRMNYAPAELGLCE